MKWTWPALLLWTTPAIAQPPGYYDPWAELLRYYPDLGPLSAVIRLLARPITCVVVCLFVGLILDHFTAAAARGPAAAPREGFVSDERTARRVALARLGAWFVALLVGLGAVGLGQLGQVIGWVVALAGKLIIGAAIIAAALFAGAALGGRGQELPLSLLGFFYLQFHPSRPPRDRRFDLGEGRSGVIRSVDPFLTTFDVGGGQVDLRPNAWLMRVHFGWSKPASGSDTS
jgi:hypothetical protein